MKPLFFIANWKSYKTVAESNNWIQEISHFIHSASPSAVSSGEPKSSGQEFPISHNNHTIIVCPPFTLLSPLYSLIAEYDLPIKLGAQDISQFDEGKFTGDINGRQVQEFVEYALIGHSERRQYHKETDDTVEKKVAMAKKYNLKPIVCIQNEKTHVPEGVSMVAYEPVFAIGSGTADTPENANTIAEQVIKSKKAEVVLYGGSVTSHNVQQFLAMPSLGGVLVGSASLDPVEFAHIISHA